MTEDEARRAREYRDRQRGGPARVRQPCPSRNGAMWHRRNGEPVCDGCRVKELEYMNRQRQRNKLRAGPGASQGQAKEDT